MKMEIQNVTVQLPEKVVLQDFSLTINEGEIHAIMGPNGTGKSTLSKVLMGNMAYPLTKGDILVDGMSILNLKTDERSRLGIFLAYQTPLSISGVKNSDFLRTALLERNDTRTLYQFIQDTKEISSRLKMDDTMLTRFLNVGFSGGERKKNEILQMALLKPKFIILDELDSGLDVDSLKIVCEEINRYKEKNQDVSILLITHYPRILEYIKPNYVHMMDQGTIKKTGDLSLAFTIEKEGYSSINEISEVSGYE